MYQYLVFAVTLHSQWTKGCKIPENILSHFDVLSLSCFIFKKLCGWRLMTTSLVTEDHYLCSPIKVKHYILQLGGAKHYLRFNDTCTNTAEVLEWIQVFNRSIMSNVWFPLLHLCCVCVALTQKYRILIISRNVDITSIISASDFRPPRNTT